MATWPAKTNYATGDVLTAAQMQDIGNALNSVGSAQYAAGKNKIINGDFNINQRGFTSTTSTLVYIYDRFSTNYNGGTVTYSAQSFTLGTAPVTGYEAKNYLDIQTSGQSASADFTRVQQSIESVRTLANQTVTVSFWAKAASGTPKVAVEIQQVFGTGGSPSSTVNTYFGQATLSTSWTRYSLTATLPSISGKTLGTANDDRLSLNFYTSAGATYDSRTGTLGTQTATISFWGIQVESGSVATPFQTATGTLAGELAACQRYYEVTGGGSVGRANATTSAEFGICYKVTKRTTPSLSLTTTAPKIYDPQVGTKTATGSTLTQVTTPTVTGDIISINGFTGLTNGGTMFTHDTDFVIISAEL